VDEPASDLGVLAAIASSVRGRAIAATTAVFGEVGLAGEIRGIPQAALRVREAAQMGFRRCVMPQVNLDSTNVDLSKPSPDSPGRDSAAHQGCELMGVRTVGEALEALLG